MLVALILSLVTLIPSGTVSAEELIDLNNAVDTPSITTVQPGNKNGLGESVAGNEPLSVAPPDTTNQQTPPNNTNQSVQQVRLQSGGSSGATQNPGVLGQSAGVSSTSVQNAQAPKNAVDQFVAQDIVPKQAKPNYMWLVLVPFIVLIPVIGWKLAGIKVKSSSQQ